MWKNFKFLHMTDVEKSDISPHDKFVRCFSGVFMLFCHILCCSLGAKVFFSDLRCFIAKSVLSRFTRFCMEKNVPERLALPASDVAVGSVFNLDFPILYALYGNKELTLSAKNCIRGEKMTNMRYEIKRAYQ